MKLSHLLMLSTIFIPGFTKAQIDVSDGPYILKTTKGMDVVAIQINVSLQTKNLNEVGSTETFFVETDLNNKTFSFTLRETYKSGEGIHGASPKLVAISDIEGDFKAFRELLQATCVIDDDLQWSFGDGHLVLTGDFFDRGDRVTETLWLIYELENQAEKAGGKVHFVLGNHETMNLQGDTRYVHPKYYFSAKAMDVPLGELYSEQTELGRWLRTKNALEKIGNILFVHGGISEKVNALDLSVSEINKRMRPHLDEYKKHENDTIQTLMWGDGPLWYRGYYGGEPVPEVIDQTLEQFGVNHIVTGHTVVADTISTHYGGKVINIDTRHADGKSEALLVKEGKYYRVDLTGKRYPLFPKQNVGEHQE